MRDGGIKLADCTVDSFTNKSAGSASGYYENISGLKEAKIVGTYYRGNKVNQAFRKKSAGTKIILVPEPANDVDSNAVAVFAALNIDDMPWKWCHVGYLQASTAKKLKLTRIVEASLKLPEPHVRESMEDRSVILPERFTVRG